jgi:hypothetical protein
MDIPIMGCSSKGKREFLGVVPLSSKTREDLTSRNAAVGMDHLLLHRGEKKRVYTVGKAKQARIRIHNVKENLKRLSVGNCGIPTVFSSGGMDKGV